jgi:hypothetical protein
VIFEAVKAGKIIRKTYKSQAAGSKLKMNELRSCMLLLRFVSFTMLKLQWKKWYDCRELTSCAAQMSLRVDVGFVVLFTRIWRGWDLEVAYNT